MTSTASPSQTCLHWSRQVGRQHYPHLWTSSSRRSTAAWFWRLTRNSWQMFPKSLRVSKAKSVEEGWGKTQCSEKRQPAYQQHFTHLANKELRRDHEDGWYISIMENIYNIYYLFAWICHTKADRNVKLCFPLIPLYGCVTNRNTVNKYIYSYLRDFVVKALFWNKNAFLGQQLLSFKRAASCAVF